MKQDKIYEDAPYLIAKIYNKYVEISQKAANDIYSSYVLKENDFLELLASKLRASDEKAIQFSPLLPIGTLLYGRSGDMDTISLLTYKKIGTHVFTVLQNQKTYNIPYIYMRYRVKVNQNGTFSVTGNVETFFSLLNPRENPMLYKPNFYNVGDAYVCYGGAKADIYAENRSLEDINSSIYYSFLNENHNHDLCDVPKLNRYSINNPVADEPAFESSPLVNKRYKPLKDIKG